MPPPHHHDVRSRGEEPGRSPSETLVDLGYSETAIRLNGDHLDHIIRAFKVWGFPWVPMPNYDDWKAAAWIADEAIAAMLDEFNAYMCATCPHVHITRNVSRYLRHPDTRVRVSDLIADTYKEQQGHLTTLEYLVFDSIVEPTTRQAILGEFERQNRAAEFYSGGHIEVLNFDYNREIFEAFEANNAFSGVSRRLVREYSAQLGSTLRAIKGYFAVTINSQIPEYPRVHMAAYIPRDESYGLAVGTSTNAA
ncbi:hypothetical protein F5Y19DRAFT_471731 [Xylariaceae sp. FL1651]|nr:hypothetical protein F5Y19DRAFT_471731 [Xylariaceae sp. FL1651]